MSYLIAGDSEASMNAARYVRNNVEGLPRNKSVGPFFEAMFNCILDFGDGEVDGWTVPNWIQFETDEDRTMFLLRWS